MLRTSSVRCCYVLPLISCGYDTYPVVQCRAVQTSAVCRVWRRRQQLLLIIIAGVSSGD